MPNTYKIFTLIQLILLTLSGLVFMVGLGGIFAMPIVLLTADSKTAVEILLNSGATFILGLISTIFLIMVE